MELRLPDFRGSKCVELDVCGIFDLGKEAQFVPLPKIQGSRISKYRGASQDVYVGLAPPYPDDIEGKLHVHLRLRPAEYFAGQLPEPNCTLEDLFALLDPFRAKKLRASLEGTFRVPKAELRPFLRSTFVETESDNIRVRMVGGTLSVRGAPIHTITWKSSDKTGRVTVTLEARTETELTVSFLEEGFQLLDSTFKAIVQSERRDG